LNQLFDQAYLCPLLLQPTTTSISMHNSDSSPLTNAKTHLNQFIDQAYLYPVLLLYPMPPPPTTTNPSGCAYQ